MDEPPELSGAAVSPPVLEDGRLADELRAVLDAHGYGYAALQELLGDEGLNLRFPDVPMHVRRCDDSPLATLVKLFYLETSASAEEAERAGVPEILLAPVADGVEASVRLDVYADLVLAADRYRAADGGRLALDHVSGLSLSSLMLAGLAVRRPVRAALDVGTGCGVQALLAARHAETVVATDVNPRALTFAEFNARLNGVRNLELVLGSFFEPVRGRRFDLVLANPPFVISPEREIMFRDSGLPGDTVSRDVIEQAPEFLDEGGLAQLLASWILREDKAWWSPVEGWVEGNGCDAWLLLFKTEDPLESASSWAKAFHGASEEDYHGATSRWLNYYRELGVATIVTGAVTLRQRGAANWLRADEFPDGAPTMETEATMRLFEAQDFLSTGPSDEEMLGQAFMVVDAHRLDRTLRRRDGDYGVEKTALVLEEGLRSTVNIDAHTVRLLTFCDGTRQLREFVAELAADLGMTQERTAEEALPVARRLIELGFLLPAR